MIIFYGEGRLGNQIFQYQALSRIASPGERIVAVGLEDLQHALELSGPRLWVLTRSRPVKGFFKYVVLPLVLRPLARTLRLINYASETWFGEAPNNGPSGEIYARTGLLRHLTFVDGGHYQNSVYWTALFPAALFEVKAVLRNAAKHFLAGIDATTAHRTFVHVRRTDYLTHSDFGLTDLALPAGFYLHAIETLRARVGATHLVFVTDDPGWVQAQFAHIGEKTIASFEAALDFAIMTECDSGILSNSTFSLAAALMLRRPDVVLAPEHWFGFRVGTWYPPRIRYEHANLVYLPALL